MLEYKLCSLPVELLLFQGWGGKGGLGGRRSLRLRLNSAEAEAEALLGLAELGITIGFDEI